MHKKLPLLLIPVLVGIDQLTKYWAMNWLQFNGPVDIIDGVFQLRYLTNHGAAWGMMENQITFFVITTLLTVALCGFVYYRIPNEKKYLPLLIMDALIIAGALGNLIDRVIYHYVVDFLYIELIDFPIFNVADMYVTVTVFVLAYFILFKYKDDEFEFLNLKKKVSEADSRENADE